MKITKKILIENKINTSYDIAQITENNFYIDYIPADNGRLTASYAHWSIYKIDGKHLWRKKFTVHCHEEKQPKLQEAIAWIKEKYGLDCSEKDPFGAYQVVETMAKIQKKLGEVKNEK